MWKKHARKAIVNLWLENFYLGIFSEKELLLSLKIDMLKKVETFVIASWLMIA